MELYVDRRLPIVYFVVPTGSFRQRGFEECYQQCVQLSNAFLDEVVGKDS